MRFLLVLFAALGLLAAAPAPRPWTEIATVAPQGSYVIGNPRSRVRMVEVLSYTCPHCADFLAESAPTIDPLIRSGRFAVEIRNQIHDQVDLAAATLARCVPAARFAAFHRTLFARQRDWVPQGFDYLQRNQARMNFYSDEARVRAVADGAGLTDLGRAVGLDDAALDRCFAGDAMRAALRVSIGVSNFSGTPGFILNGKNIERVTWADMKTRLAALGPK